MVVLTAFSLISFVLLAALGDPKNALHETMVQMGLPSFVAIIASYLGLPVAEGLLQRDRH